MARRYGRSLRGKRVDGPAPHGHWKTTTFVGGLTSRGFIAPCVTDGAMSGAIFKAWTEQMSAPALQPGDIVVMDNLPAHKVAGIREAIAARGAELRHLPPRSPDLLGAPLPSRSSRPSPSSRRSRARPPSAPSTASGTPSASCSTCSRRQGAPTASPTRAMYSQRESTCRCSAPG